MTDKIVTHEDLPMLRKCRAACEDADGPVALLFDRLIAAAEADRPPLPEGWVVYDTGNDGQTVYWHEAGRLFVYRASVVDREGLEVERFTRDRLTPLRPAVTEADVERAAQTLGKWTADYRKTTILRIFEAVGIEVTS